MASCAPYIEKHARSVSLYPQLAEAYRSGERIKSICGRYRVGVATVLEAADNQGVPRRYLRQVPVEVLPEAVAARPPVPAPAPLPPEVESLNGWIGVHEVPPVCCPHCRGELPWPLIKAWRD